MKEALASVGCCAAYVVVTDVSAQPTVHIFKDQAAVRIEFFLECLTTDVPKCRQPSTNPVRANANIFALDRVVF